MPDFVIKTTFRGADKLSPVLKKLGIRVKQTGRDAEKSFRRASKQVKVFGGVVKGILAAGIVQRAFSTAGMAVRGLADEFVDFDENITKAVTRLPGQLDRTSKEFAQLSAAARSEAAKTEFTAGQTAAAVEQLALAGFKAQEVMGLLPGVLQLATNAGVDVADATRMATKSMGAFGMRAGTTAEKQRNLTRVNDVFSRAVSSAALNIEDLFETLKFAGPSMFAAGQSIETFAAATELLADRSIDASRAGTALRMAFTRLAKPPREAQVALKKLRIEVEKDGKFRNFADILADIEKKTAAMGNRQRLATLSTIFGVRAQGAMNALVEAGSDEFRKYTKRLEDAGGASEKMADTIRTSIGVRLKILRSALIELGFKFITAFTGKAGKGLDDLVARVRKFDMKPVVQGVKDAVKFIKELWKALKPIRDNMDIIVGLWLSYKAALIAVTTIGAVVFHLRLAKALLKAGKAQAFLNAMFLANPIGLTIIAVAALIAVIGFLIWKWDEVGLAGERFVTTTKIGFLQLWMTLKQVFADFINFHIKGLNELIGAINKIPGVEIPTISLIEFDVEGDLKEIKRLQDALKDIKAEETGTGVQRGMAGLRGVRGRGAAAPAPVSDIAQAIGRELEIPQGATRFGPAEQAAQLVREKARSRDIAREAVQAVLAETLQAPNRSEVEAQRFLVEGQFSFENPPAGMSFEGKTTGGKPVKTEGLGTQ